MNFQMFKLDLEKAEEPEIKLPTSVGSSKNQEFQKNIYFCFIDYANAFDSVDHNKLWKILQGSLGIPDYLTCLLRNLYAGQEATVKTEHGTTDWFQIGKGVFHCVVQQVETDTGALISPFPGSALSLQSLLPVPSPPLPQSHLAR